jgi:pimeloyl-ACP methyl ester carboxylesterase
MTSPNLDGVAAPMPELDGVSHSFVTLASGVRLHVAEAGQGEPLVLLHGWPQHWYGWHKVVPDLAPHYRLLMPDLRGFGWSDAPGGGYDGPTFASDTVALLDALGLDRVKLIAHDWGGWTAFLLALEHPDRIERMLVVNAPTPWARPSLDVLRSLWRTWYVLLNATIGPAVIRRTGYVPWFLGLGGKRDVYPPGETDIYRRVLAEPARARASAVLYRYYLRRAFQVFVRRRFEAQRLTVPTRLVFGADDFFVPTSYLTGSEAHGDDFTIELVPGCGHFLPEERPHLVVERALELFGSGGADRPRVPG